MRGSMFSQPSVAEYYSTLHEEMKKEIYSQKDSYLLTVNIDEYSDFLFNKHALSPIECDFNKVSIEKFRKQIQVNDFGEKVSVEHVYVRIYIPVAPNAQIRKILELKASTFTLSPAKMSYIDGKIITEAEAKETEIQRTIDEVKQEIEWRNRDIQLYNEPLKTQIRSTIMHRKNKIKNEEELLDQITKKIPVVLRKRDKATSTIFPTVKVKEKIMPIMPPRPTQPEEIRLKEAQFKATLRLINHTCLAFERTPTTFLKLEEEDLRDIILSSLNGVFEGDAHGEAFSKLGKTDIYLKVSKGGVFIAECKFWQG